MSYAPEDEEEPPQVRRLRMLVMVLIVVLILGFVAMVGTIVIRLGFPDQRPQPIAADALSLPAGHDIIATGQGKGTVHVLLRDPDGSEMLYVFDARTGAELSKTAIIRD